MSYYNRINLLNKTLKSIERFNPQDLEIIIVDDASPDPDEIDGVLKKFSLDIKIFKLEKNQKTWMNPCIPNNIGFSHASGDVIIIQNPECIHYGDIINKVKSEIKENTYLNFACYSIDKKTTDQIDDNLLFFEKKNKQKSINIIRNNISRVKFGGQDSLAFTRIDLPAGKNGTHGWYNHSQIKPQGYHFCSAITYKDLCDLSGFDERFANGLAYDDNEFLHRIRKKKMRFMWIDNPYVIHQFHESVAPPERVPKDMRINYQLLQNTVKSEQYNVRDSNKYFKK